MLLALGEEIQPDYSDSCKLFVLLLAIIMQKQGHIATANSFRDSWKNCATGSLSPLHHQCHSETRTRGGVGLLVV